MRSSGIVKGPRGAHRSLRHSAVVWGSALAIATGSLTAWGVSAPAAESSGAAPASSQSSPEQQVAAATSDSRSHQGKNRWQGKTDRWKKYSDTRWWDRWDRNHSNNNSGGVDVPDTVTPPPAETPEPAPVVPPVTEDKTPAPVVPPVSEPTETPAPTTGLPTAATTGVPSGITLSSTNGLTVTTNGAVIDAKLVKGDIVIKANNVTIKNSKVDGRVHIRPPYTGLKVQSTEIAGPGTAWAAETEAIGYANFSCDRCDIHGWGKGVMMDGNVSITNSWIHDMPVAPGTHNEAILSLGGSNYNIVNNRLDAGSAGNFTAALSLLNQWGSLTDILVKDNQFNGGGYCVYGGGEARHNSKNPSSNIRFIDNTFGSEKNAKCGYYGAAIAWDSSGPGNHWSGNAMSNGTVVHAPSAG